VHDAGVGWHHLQRVERPLAPAQEAIALLVALELALGVDLEGVSGGEGVDLESCISTRAGVKAISLLGCALASQLASASTSAADTDPLPSVRNRFSSSTFSENGRRATSKRCCSESRRNISYARPPTSSVCFAPKLFMVSALSRL
jgi:hypothetical protein